MVDLAKIKKRQKLWKGAISDKALTLTRLHTETPEAYHSRLKSNNKIIKLMIRSKPQNGLPLVPKKQLPYFNAAFGNIPSLKSNSKNVVRNHRFVPVGEFDSSRFEEYVDNKEARAKRLKGRKAYKPSHRVPAIESTRTLKVLFVHKNA